MTFLDDLLDPLAPASTYLCQVERWHVWCQKCNQQIDGALSASRSRITAESEASRHNEWHQEMS